MRKHLPLHCVGFCRLALSLARAGLASRLVARLIVVVSARGLVKRVGQSVRTAPVAA